MSRSDPKSLRCGWTTGACATAATKAALQALWGGLRPASVNLVLPRGETPVFVVETLQTGDGWAEAGIIKDAGDDPDVTHNAMIRAHVAISKGGVVFRAGPGVGTVTKPGLPIAVGEAAINPVPREMMKKIVTEQSKIFTQQPDIIITISVPDGKEIATKTWNPRLGIKGGISILGTTGVVRPFSCAAWIASIHRGIDVARASHQRHVAGCTGATSERTVQGLFDLPDYAMLDMGDFAGGLLKYLARHPVERLTIGGGIGKMTKLAQGARDLHSRRSQVNFDLLASWTTQAGLPDVQDANTALEALDRCGASLAEIVAAKALETVKTILANEDIAADVVIIDRAGQVLARTDL